MRAQNSFILGALRSRRNFKKRFSHLLSESQEGEHVSLGKYSQNGNAAGLLVPIRGERPEVREKGTQRAREGWQLGRSWRLQGKGSQNWEKTEHRVTDLHSKKHKITVEKEWETQTHKAYRTQTAAVCGGGWRCQSQRGWESWKSDLRKITWGWFSFSVRDTHIKVIALFF